MQELAARHQQLCRDRQQRFWREAEAQRLAFQARGQRQRRRRWPVPHGTDCQGQRL